MSLSNKNVIRDVFLNSYCKDQNYHRRTIQTFIQSLRNFYDFVFSENLEQFNKDEGIQMKLRLPTWKSSYKKAHKIVTMRKLEH